MSHDPGPREPPGGGHRDDDGARGAAPGADRPGPPPWGPVPPWLSPRAMEGRSRAETALILGILGIVVLPLLGPFAIWQAHEAEKLGVPATAGRVLGWVGTVLLGLMVVFFALWLGFVGFLIGSGGG